MKSTLDLPSLETQPQPTELMALEKLAEQYFAVGANLPRVSRELHERVDPDSVETNDEDRSIL